MSENGVHGQMIAMRALDTAARRKGNGLAWLFAGVLESFVEVKLCPWRKPRWARTPCECGDPACPGGVYRAPGAVAYMDGI